MFALLISFDLLLTGILTLHSIESKFELKTFGIVYMFIPFPLIASAAPIIGSLACMLASSKLI